MWKFTKYYVIRFWYLVLAEFVVTSCLAAETVIRPYILKIITDKIGGIEIEDASFGPLIFYFFVYLSLYSFTLILSMLNVVVWVKINYSMKKEVLIDIMHNVFGKSYSFFKEHLVGDLTSRIDNMISAVPDLTKVMIEKIYHHIFIVIIALLITLTINIKIAICMFLWTIIYVVASVRIISRGVHLYKNTAAKAGIVSGYVVDVVSNIISTMLFMRHQWELKKISKVMKKYIIAAKRRDTYLLKLITIQGLSFLTYQGLCLYFLMQALAVKTITAGDLVFVLIVNIPLINSLWTLSKEIGSFMDLYGKIKQGVEKLDLKESQDDLFLDNNNEFCNGDIVFENLCFGYTEGKKIFNNINLTIKKGEKVGIVGLSGSGKSTFINLLLGLHHPQAGRIVIGGEEINKNNISSLRRNISASIQSDNILFHRTIIENIRYGNVNSSNKEVEEAAKLAKIHNLILSLPEGYDTLVGERGVKLSGGEKQRIMIARAFLREAPILILDEITSQLDVFTESAIMESLSHLKSNKTVIMVAHRLSTIAFMDRILVFNNGSIVEDGSMKELMKFDGYFKTLWDVQIERFIA